MNPDIEAKFWERGIPGESVLILSADDAIELIETAKSANRPILGVDSFIVAGSQIQPLLEHILDFSYPSGPFDSWVEAQKFIEDRRYLGYRFEVVIKGNTVEQDAAANP